MPTLSEQWLAVFRMSPQVDVDFDFFSFYTTFPGQVHRPFFPFMPFFRSFLFCSRFRGELSTSITSYWCFFFSKKPPFFFFCFCFFFFILFPPPSPSPHSICSFLTGQLYDSRCAISTCFPVVGTIFHITPSFAPACLLHRRPQGFDFFRFYLV